MRGQRCEHAQARQAPSHWYVADLYPGLVTPAQVCLHVCYGLARAVFTNAGQPVW